MKRHVGKSLLALLLAFAMVASFCVPVLAANPGEAVMNGAGADGNTDIHVPVGGTAHVVYTADYKDPTGVSLDGLASVFFYIDYDNTKMAYNKDATGETENGAIVLDKNDIETKDYGTYAQYKDDIRIMKAGLRNTQFKVLIDLTNVTGNDTLTLGPIECYARIAGSQSDQAELTFAQGTNPNIIVQNPVTVNITGSGTVTTTTKEYNAGQKSFATSGTATTLTSGDTIYVDSDSGAQSTPSFTFGSGVTPTILVNGTAVTCTVSGNTYTLPTAVSANSTITINLSGGGGVTPPPSTNYTVTFDANGHGTAPQMQTVVSGSQATAPTEPTASGFTFGGWYTTPACTGSAYSFSTPVTGNLTLYAKWTATTTPPPTGDVTYTVSHYKESGYGTGVYTLAETESLHAASGTAVEAHAKTYPNYQVDYSVAGTNRTGTAAEGLSLRLYYRATSQTPSGLKAGEITMNGADKDGNTLIRVKYGETAHVVYTAAFESPTGYTLTSLSGTFFYVDYDASKSTYHEDATCIAGTTPTTLNLNNIETKNTGEYAARFGDIRIFKAGINQMVFKVLIDFTDVHGTDTLTVYPADFSGNTADNTVKPSLNYVEGIKPTIVLQYPTKVTIAGNIPGNTVSTKVKQFITGEDTYAPDGSDKILSTGDTVYVDSGDGQNNRASFTVTNTATKALSQILVNGTDVIASCSVTGSGLTRTYTLPAAITGDENITFQFGSAGTYTVNFAQNSYAPVSGMPASQSVEAGNTATQPATQPTSNGYTFGGWYVDSSCTTAFNFASPIMADTTIYAKWTPNYTVTFAQNLAGVAVTGMPSAQTVTEGALVTTPTTPSAVGYNFAGWYKDSACTTAWSFATDRITGNTTIYASWNVAGNIPYKVEYYKETGLNTGDYAMAETVTLQGTTGATVTAPVKEYTGYAVDYSNPSTVMSGSVIGNGSLVLKLYYKATGFSVTYIPGSTAVTGMPSPNPVMIAYGARLTKPADPSLPGSNFMGWYKDAAGTQPWNFDTDTVSNTTLLYAKWTNNYSVQFAQNLAGITVSGLPATQSVVAGGTVTEPATDPTATGYSFNGWFKDSQCTIPWNFATDTVSGSTTIYAGWTANYTVIFAQNLLGVNVRDLPSNQTVSRGGLVSQPTKAPTALGYTFTGWYKDSACQVAWNFATDTVLGNTTLYAGWQAATGVGYRVQHYLETGLNTNIYTMRDEDDLYGTVGQMAYASPKTYEGYGVDYNVDGTVYSGIIAADNSLVLKIYYRFSQVTHQITGSVDGGNGIIVPQGVVTVNDGGQLVFGYLPNEGYGIASVTVDGQKADPFTNQQFYPFNDVTADHSIVVTFGVDKNGDGIADSEQIAVTFETATHDTSLGNIDGAANQTVYLNKVEGGAHLDSIPTCNAASGYQFGSWAYNGVEYSDSEALKTVVFTADSTVTVNFVESNNGKVYYALSFVTNNGTPVNSITALAGTTINLATTAVSTREGFTLKEWCLDPELTQPVTDVTLDDNVTVYAKWERTGIPDAFTPDHVAYVDGYPDGTVRPEKAITRAEVATIFFNLLSDKLKSNTTTSNSFSDVSGGDWFNTAVSTLASMKILAGYPDGTFKPNSNITRAEFATIASRFSTATYEGPDIFTDIANHWARDYINVAAYVGWVVGNEGKFRPNDMITRAEAFTLVNRVLGRMPESTDDLLGGMKTFRDNANTSSWYYLAVQEAANAHEYAMKDDTVHEFWTKLVTE